jgi:hypothetical protein
MDNFQSAEIGTLPANDLARGNAHLSPAQKAWAELDKQFAIAVKPILDARKEALIALEAENGVGTYFQDDDGVVYLVDDKKGQWIDFTAFEVKRTRRAGEVKGSLSMKQAEEAGFTVLR